MNLSLNMPMRTQKDRLVLNLLQVWCNQNHVNLLVGEGLLFVSLHFSGNSTAIAKLKAYLDTKA